MNIKFSWTLSWHGQACYALISPQGTRILIDPIPDSIGYKPGPLRADVVTISHEHFDHANVGLAKGNPAVLRGLTRDQKGWEKHDRRFGDIRIRNVGVYHDKSKGKERGLNSVFIFESGGIRLGHLGDLGHLLDADQIQKIGKLDVILVPVGGFYTIDAQEAHQVIQQLGVRCFILPMHYRTDVLTIRELASVDAFIEGKTHVERWKGNTLKIDAAEFPPSPKIILLDYK